MLEKRAWVEEHFDHLRTALMLEPRGHADMYGALLTEPEHPGSDAGVLFMHNQGYSTMCGHGVIAVVTLALEQGLIVPRRAGRARARYAGRIRSTPSRRSTARRAGRASTGVSFRNVPSFVLLAGVPVRLGSRTLLADVAFGGAFYAIVDSEAAGIPIAAGAPRRPPARRHGDQARARIDADDRAPRAAAAPAASTGRSSPDRRPRPMPICGTSRSSPTPRSIDRPAAPAPARSWRSCRRWACSPRSRPSLTRASSARASAGGSSAKPRSPACRRSCRSLPARRS